VPPTAPDRFSQTQPQVLGLRVLLVEDNRNLAEVTEALLASHGAKAVVVRSAQEALRRVADDRGGFDVVLSDVVMPGALDGIGLARQLRRSHPGLPVVLMSGYSSALTSVRDLTVLRKPVGEEELIQALRAAVTGVPTP
jgi:CheY-like chemotaxis protein